MSKNVTRSRVRDHSDERQIKRLEKELRELEEERALEPGKCMGKCGSCNLYTVLVADVGLCGPCCFGEADTLNGNW